LLNELTLLAEALINRPALLLFLISAILGIIAWRKPRFITWLMAGVSVTLFVFCLCTVEVSSWIPEILQCLFIWLMVLYHRFGDLRKERFVAAYIVAGIGLGRYYFLLAGWTAAVAALEAVIFILAGTFLRQRPYVFVGLLQGAGLALALLYH